MEFISQLKVVHTPVKLSKGLREKRVVISLGMIGDSH